MIVGAQSSRPHPHSLSRSRLASALDAAERWWGRGPGPGVGRCAGDILVVHATAEAARFWRSADVPAGTWTGRGSGGVESWLTRHTVAPIPEPGPSIDPTEPVPDDPGELLPDAPEPLPPPPIEPTPGDPGGVPEPA